MATPNAIAPAPPSRSWSSLRVLAIAQVEQEPILSGHLYDLVLRHRGYPQALAYLIAATLSNQVFSLAAIKAMDEAGKIVAGLCHGPWIMISAKVLKGRTVCAYVGMVDDMVNSGANVVDAEVITDGNIITCSYYGYVGKFMQAVFAAVEGRTSQQPAIRAAA